MRVTSQRIHPAWVISALSLLLLLSACRGEPTATPVPAVSELAPVDLASLPVANSTILIEPETGGSIRLRSGASVTFPPKALSASAAATLRIAADLPAVPIPRSLLGEVYELALEGGELTGLALVRLPVPAEVNAGEYDLAPYRWNGNTWERMNGRLANGEIQVGLNTPALISLQGQWNLADASLTLVRVDTPPGQLTIPLAVAGQYRYSALPMLSGDVVPAQLRLKQDTSGGAGRIAGDEALDATLDEAILWFKPDPAASQARIEFSHVFDLDPTLIDLAPGATTRFYTVLIVEDSAAPTRRLSTGMEYAQVLPLRIIGREVVRPRLIGEERYSLRWHVRLNEQTFSQLPATQTSLPIDGILAQGGLGDYTISLEANVDGAWLAVSNAVTVQLALRPTATPEPGQEPPLVALVTATPPGTPAALGTRPLAPTRRPGPAGGSNPGAGELALTPTATLAISLTITPTASRPAGANVFWADHYAMAAGECTLIHWQVENVTSVFFNDAPVTGQETREVCQTTTTTYRLRINGPNGTEERSLTITVATPGETPIEFTADAYQIAKDQCTNLRWRVTNVRSVKLNGAGVAGEANTSVCLQATTDYVLQVEDNEGRITSRKITIYVTVTDQPLIRFWADRYALPAGGSTTLHWRVQNVQEVRLDGAGVNGIGDESVSPGNGQFYTLQVTTQEGAVLERQLAFTSGDPSIGAGQVIAQGIVRDVSRLVDVDQLTPGDQYGHYVTIDGISVLFANAGGWAQAAVMLAVPQSVIDMGDDTVLHWPISSSQQVEFRAVCEGANCTLVPEQLSYLYLRSE